ncbi:toll/interleukin-1 receptor domain-containing protein [Rhodococcus sp. JT-3]|uniref:toll/interleukin-1 receptor domain-containing protein n=1 Tax=Rhodococcus sp. JT-3 TaxID=1973213 RepID=UPI0013030D8B|nr:toll/interleukin-1 receptor domain-containing protein [Rhodococcus sp. JT-3]
MADSAVDTGKLKIFISWSGKLSEEVAKVWHSLLTEMFNNVSPFMSEKDIEAGTRGLPTIANELHGSKFGIVVVTQENLHSQWLNYETGALSKDINDPDLRVAPTLVDFKSKADATGPISQFQATLLDHDGVKTILEQVGQVVDVDPATVDKRFERAWLAEFEELFEVAKSPYASSGNKARRHAPDKLDEVLTTVREIQRQGANAIEDAKRLERAAVIKNAVLQLVNAKDFPAKRILGLNSEDEGITFVIDDDADSDDNSLRDFLEIIDAIDGKHPSAYISETEYDQMTMN